MRAKAPIQPKDRSATRRRILEASLQVFGEKGFTAATTKDIAKRAKVNEVTVFRLFGSKKDLFAEAVMEGSPLAQIRKAVSFKPDTTLDELMVTNAKTALSVLRANKHLFMVMYGDAWRQPKVREVIGDMLLDKGVEFLAEFFEAQMDTGRIRRMDPVIAARAWMGTIQAHFIVKDMLGSKKLGQIDEDKMIRGFVSIFLDGMRNGTGGEGA
jgi:AcrR family transcriptional regulator